MSQDILIKKPAVRAGVLWNNFNPRVIDLTG
jgi:hypothetical protein